MRVALDARRAEIGAEERLLLTSTGAFSAGISTLTKCSIAVSLLADPAAQEGDGTEARAAGREEKSRPRRVRVQKTIELVEN